MNRLDTNKRATILGLMTEGCSLRSISRITNASKNTISKLLRDVGEACAEYQNNIFRNLNCKRMQVDEIWSFCYAKEKNVSTAKAAPEFAGDVWTWVAIDADTKLVPSWFIGKRDAEDASVFIDDLACRLNSKVQLTSDGHKSYLTAVEDAFGSDVDYAMLIKQYGKAIKDEKRYSPAACVGAKKTIITGKPEKEHISTSYIERQNLNIRMGNRRFTRLTNAFSKKIENHQYAMALYFMHYNFIRIHQTLRVTPAMAAGVTNKLWDYKDIIDLLND